MRALVLLTVLFLAACAAPSAEQKVAQLDELFGRECTTQATPRGSPAYRACTLRAYSAKRQTAIATYDADAGKTAIGLLLLPH